MSAGRPRLNLEAARQPDESGRGGASAVQYPLQQTLYIFACLLVGLGAEAMVSLFDALGAVGLGDQPVSADQADAAVRKPEKCLRTRTEFFRSASVPSVMPQSQVGQW